MRYPIKDKFWGWRMDLFEVLAYWDSRRTSPNWHWHWHWLLVCSPCQLKGQREWAPLQQTSQSIRKRLRITYQGSTRSWSSSVQINALEVW